MMVVNHLHLLFLAFLQGVTELFPISSLGHSVLVPGLLHWKMNRDAIWFLPFIVILHLGTATALLIYFRRDWIRLFRGFWLAKAQPSNPDSRLLWLLMLGTVPAGLIGLILEHKIRHLFTDFHLVALMLMLNGLLLIIGDRLRRLRRPLNLDQLSIWQAVGIGLAQSLALIPGLSRSGATLVAGLGVGLQYEDAARFSFLLATPIIAAAGVLEVPKLLRAHLPPELLVWILLSGLVAGFFAWASTWFLMRWFKTQDIAALTPFAIYCLILGGVAFWIG